MRRRRSYLQLLLYNFDWDPEPRARRRSRQPEMGLVAQLYPVGEEAAVSPELEGFDPGAGHDAAAQIFYQVVRSDPGECMVLRDILIGGEAEVIERTASRIMRPGDLGYGQLWKLPEVTTLGRLAPL